MIRSSGVLMAIPSLPSPYGIGTMGKAAEQFIDFLAEAGQTYWQILPIGPTGFGNSPYTEVSTFAGNPYLIDLDRLIEDGLLKKSELKGIDWGDDPEKVDYGKLYNSRRKVLQKAVDRLPLKHPEDYYEFLQKNPWLKDYGTFMAIKDDRNGAAWTTWPKELRNHRSEAVRKEAERLAQEIIYYERVQYLFYKQMIALKKYANSKGIQIIGDLPFYAAADSCDVWANPEQFAISKDYEMSFVSGFPGDAGNPKGQKWGNPLFNWEYQKSQNYAWWIGRVAHMRNICDVIRLDHFQGYDQFFAIPAADPDAKNGHWVQGPGLELFKRMEEKLGKLPVIVEDLGHLTPAFLAMVKASGYPGMRILEYAFDPNDPGSLYMPFQHERSSVCYLGTHDNETLAGWLKNPEQKKRVERAVQVMGLNEKEGYHKGMLRALWSSPADLAIVQMQDLLELDNSARMNDPVNWQGAWTWRMKPKAITARMTKEVKSRMLLFCRNNWNAEKIIEKLKETVRTKKTA